MKGQMGIYSILFGFFAIMIIFIALDKTFSGTLMTNSIAELNTTNTTFSQNIKSSLQTFNNVWLYIPLFIFIGLMYAGIKNSQRD